MAAAAVPCPLLAPLGGVSEITPLAVTDVPADPQTGAMPTTGDSGHDVASPDAWGDKDAANRRAPPIDWHEPLVPETGIAETWRILSDGTRRREPLRPFGAVLGAIVVTGLVGARALYRHRHTPRPSPPATRPPEDLAARTFVDGLLHNRPVFDRTDPVINHAAELLVTGRGREFQHFVAAHYHKTAPHLMPVLQAMVQYGTQGSTDLAQDLAELSEILTMRMQRNLAPTPGNSAATFAAINILGIAGYNDRLFHAAIAQRLGATLLAAETTLGRMVLRLPANAVVADFGGGAGVFAAEIKALRSDLDVYVNDLETPETIVAANPQAHLDAATLRRSATYPTGDAMMTCLPGGEKADLLVANSLSQYVSDPLALIAHLYAQLTIGGYLVMSLNSAIFAADRAQRQERGAMGKEIAAELKAAGVPALWTGDTLIIRRPDQRALRVVATLYAANITAVNLQPLWAQAAGYAATVAVIDKYQVIYRPATGAGARWLGLVGRP